MPLSPFQMQVAELLAVNRSPDSYLAGGAAMHIEPNSKRTSNDLDYFQDSEERVASAFAEDRRLLESAGYTLEVLLQQPGFVRVVVGRGRGHVEGTKVEWVRDSAWRFLPTIRSPKAGFMLNSIDLAVNKLLALIGRDEPRDYLDIHEAMKVLPLGAICWAAAGKDPGYSPAMILDLLRRRGKYRPEDFVRLDLAEPVNLSDLKQSWRAALEDAALFFATRDPLEIGCLYYSRARGAFVQPVPGEQVVPHYGRPGGVLPMVGPEA